MHNIYIQYLTIPDMCVSCRTRQNNGGENPDGPINLYDDRRPSRDDKPTDRSFGFDHLDNRQERLGHRSLLLGFHLF